MLGRGERVDQGRNGWMVYQQLNGHESEQTPPGHSEGQGSLVCCSSRGSKGLDNDLETEQQQQM